MNIIRFVNLNNPDNVDKLEKMVDFSIELPITIYEFFKLNDGINSEHCKILEKRGLDYSSNLYKHLEEIDKNDRIFQITIEKIQFNRELFEKYRDYLPASYDNWKF